MSLPAGYPLMYPFEQRLVARPLPDVAAAVRAELDRWPGWEALPRNAQIGITAGSRGIANIPLILRTLGEELGRRGHAPFLVVAMGSHGGGTLAGQLAVLEGLGITPESVGMPIRGTLEVDEVGRSARGFPVVVDREAHRADGLVVVNRVKKHTDFDGPVESGLAKMMAIGLGKSEQAAYIHSFGAEGLRTLIPEFAGILLAHSPVLFGLALVEDGYEATSDIVLLPREQLLAQEPVILQKAVTQMARLPVSAIDVLIVERMGKEISGSGMDTNVIGRYRVPGVPDPVAPRVRYLVVLDLTPGSHGNAIGVGLADLTTTRLTDQIDRASFYANSIASGFLERSKVPLACPTDRAAIDMALRLLAPLRPEEARVVRIQDTLHLSRFAASAALVEELRVRANVATAGPPAPLSFAGDGRLR